MVDPGEMGAWTNGLLPSCGGGVRHGIFGEPAESTASQQSSEETALPTNGSANSGALHDELALIAEFWPTLSQHVKTMILNIIRPAERNTQDG